MNAETPVLEAVKGDDSSYEEVAASRSLGEFIGRACYRFHETLGLKALNFYVKDDDHSVVYACVEKLNGDIVATFELVFDKEVC